MANFCLLTKLKIRKIHIQKMEKPKSEDGTKLEETKRKIIETIKVLD